MDGPDSCVPDRATEPQSLDDFCDHYTGPLGSRALAAGPYDVLRSGSRKRLSPDAFADGAGERSLRAGSTGSKDAPPDQSAANSSAAAMLLGVWANTSNHSGSSGQRPPRPPRFIRSPSVPLGLDASLKSQSLASTDQPRDAASKIRIVSSSQFTSQRTHPEILPADDVGAQQVPVLTPDRLAATAVTTASFFPAAHPYPHTNTDTGTPVVAGAGGPSAGQPYSALLSGPGFSYSNDTDDDNLSHDISMGSADSDMGTDSGDGGFMIDSVLGVGDGEGMGTGCGSSRGACGAGGGYLPASAVLALARPVGSAHSGSGGCTICREGGPAAPAAAAAAAAAVTASPHSAGAAAACAAGATAAAFGLQAGAAAAPEPMVFATAAAPLTLYFGLGVERPNPGEVGMASVDTPDNGAGEGADVGRDPRDARDGSQEYHDHHDHLTGVGSTPLSDMQSCEAGVVEMNGLRAAVAAAAAAWSPEEYGGEEMDPDMLLRSGSSESVGSVGGASVGGAVAADATAAAADVPQAAAPALAAVPAAMPAGSAVIGGGSPSDLVDDGGGAVTHGSFMPAAAGATILSARGLAHAGGTVIPGLPVLIPPFPGGIGLAPGPMAPVSGSQPAGAWAVPPAVAAGQAEPAAGGIGSRSGTGYEAESARDAGSVTAAAPALPALLPPEMYLGFITQLVESVRTATRAVTCHAAVGGLAAPGGATPEALHHPAGAAAQPVGQAAAPAMTLPMGAADGLLLRPQQPHPQSLQHPGPGASAGAAAGFEQTRVGTRGGAGDMHHWPGGIGGGGGPLGVGAVAVSAPQLQLPVAEQLLGAGVAAGPALASWLVTSDGTSDAGSGGAAVQRPGERYL